VQPYRIANSSLKEEWQTAVNQNNPPGTAGWEKEKNSMNSKLLTVAEVAASMGLSRATIRKWVLLRKITNIRLGRAVRIEEAELQRLLLAGRRPAAKGPPEKGGKHG